MIFQFDLGEKSVTMTILWWTNCIQCVFWWGTVITHKFEHYAKRRWPTTFNLVQTYDLQKSGISWILCADFWKRKNINACISCCCDDVLQHSFVKIIGLNCLRLILLKTWNGRGCDWKLPVWKGGLKSWIQNASRNICATGVHILKSTVRAIFQILAALSLYFWYRSCKK